MVKYVLLYVDASVSAAYAMLSFNDKLRLYIILKHYIATICNIVAITFIAFKFAELADS